MLDHLDKLYTTSIYMLPAATFMIGLVGSMHCVGMCGGIVMSCTPKKSNNIFYQLGRLTSYLLLAGLAGFLGSYFSFSQSHPMASIVPGVMIGIILIWIGSKQFIGSSRNLKIPTKLNNLIMKVWGKVLPNPKEEVTHTSSFLVGSISILLPCAMLYGVILTLAAFNSPLISLICIFTFWIGTLPVMSMAPAIIKNLIKPLYLKMPRISSSLMILIGLGTILNRIYLSYSAIPACH